MKFSAERATLRQMRNEMKEMFCFRLMNYFCI